MNDAAQMEAPTGMAGQSPVTRMWFVIQKLSRTRDAYARAKDNNTRLNVANDISDLVDLLRVLADALLEEIR